jgi:hypothetical protein
MHDPRLCTAQDVATAAQQPQAASTTAAGSTEPEFFFARVPPTVTYEELLEVFERYGPVEDLNLFRCGTPAMRTFEGPGGKTGPVCAGAMPKSRTPTLTCVTTRPLPPTHRPFAEAKIHKGCGIVRFASSAAAAAAKAALHDKHTWASDYAPMVLERVNAKKKRSSISNGGKFHVCCSCCCAERTPV